MKKISCKNRNFEKAIRELVNREPFSGKIERSVRRILQDIKHKGDSAIKYYAWKFDKVNLTSQTFKVSKDKVKTAYLRLTKKQKEAIKGALTNIKSFAERRIPKAWSYTPRKGVIVGERFEPFDRVAVYIPGGAAPLVSTVLHTAGIASAAGVKEIVAFTPPGFEGDVHPAILYALNQCGVSEIYRLGGVYAIGAAAYGTKTIEKVEKIVGPGNAYVAAAKKIVYGEVAIDMVAGPSEIMIIADENSNPDFIFADMLSQAEHGSGFEQAVLVSTSPKLITRIKRKFTKLYDSLNKHTGLAKVIKNGIFFVEVETLDDAAEIASLYAPEHLEIQVPQAGTLAKKVKAAGAIFLGKWTPEPVGDFTAGPSHVLPTGGTARFFTGLTVEQFFRRMSVINYQKSALKNEIGWITSFAEIENLEYHGKSASVRFDE